MLRRCTTAGLALALIFATAGCKEDKPQPASGAASATAQAAASATGETKAAVGSAKEAADGDGTARSHVPAGCDIAGRFEIKEVLENDKVGKVLVDALNKIQNDEPTDPDKKKALAALKAMDIDLTKDVHEVALCVNDVMKAKGQEPPDFAFLVSGDIDKGKFVPAMKESEAKVTETEIGGIKALTNDKKEVYMGQAGDGVVVIAKGKEGFEKAVGAHGEGMKEHSIPEDKSSALVVKGSVIKEALAKQKDNPLAAHTANIEGLVVYWDIDDMKTEIRAAMTSEKAAIEFAGALKMILTELSKPNPRNPMAGAMAVLSKAKVDSDGKDTTVIIETSDEDADKAIAELSKTLGAL